jgi:hypothetical protein
MRRVPVDIRSRVPLAPPADPRQHRRLRTQRRPKLAAAAAHNLAVHGVGMFTWWHVTAARGCPMKRRSTRSSWPPRFPSSRLRSCRNSPKRAGSCNPIGPGGAEDVTLFRRDASGRLVRERSIVRAYFVPLYGRYGFPGDR